MGRLRYLIAAAVGTALLSTAAAAGSTATTKATTPSGACYKWVNVDYDCVSSCDKSKYKCPCQGICPPE